MIVTRRSSTVSLQGHYTTYAYSLRKHLPRHPVLRTFPTDMALAKSVYHLLFRRTSTFAVTIMVGAIFFERIFDQGGDAIFEQMNRGVSVVFCVFNACFILTLQVEGEAGLTLAKLACPLNGSIAVFRPPYIYIYIYIVSNVTQFFSAETMETHQTQLREQRRGIGRDCEAVSHFVYPFFLDFTSESSISQHGQCAQSHAQAGSGYQMICGSWLTVLNTMKMEHWFLSPHIPLPVIC